MDDKNKVDLSKLVFVKGVATEQAEQAKQTEQVGRIGQNGQAERNGQTASRTSAPSVGYLGDAWRRFAKNKSSLFALFVIFALVLFCLFAPMLTPYRLTDKDSVYSSKRPYLQSLAGSGFWDGGRENEFTAGNYDYFKAISEETGLNPVIKERGSYEKTSVAGKKTTMYRLRIDSYKEVGVVNGLNLSAEAFARVCAYQDETGKQILYPLVDNSKLYGFDKGEGGGNFWYEIDQKGKPILSNGAFRPLYLSVEKGSATSGQYAPYESRRIAADDGSFVYGRVNQSGYSTRICYYEYYRFLHGRYPSYAFGTNAFGQDMVCALAKGGGFSLGLAFAVSALNLLIGCIYGAIEGYFGGAIDLALERVSDVLSGVPFTVVVTLFSYHLATKVGVIVSFLFAFLTTGWISTASLTRKQVYRYKNREYVMAARLLGASHGRILFRHIFPNCIGTIITSAAMLIPAVIGLETTLTYLGIVNLSGAGATSLGTLIELGKSSLEFSPHALLFPALFLAVVMICFNLVGNGLRDAFNPSLRFAE